MSVQIRPATAGDAAALSVFAAETFCVTYAAFNTAENMAAYTGATFSPERQRGEIEDPTGFVLLAVEHAEIVGYAQIAPGHGALEIKRFYIAPTRHGRGVAQVLMGAVVRSAAARGAGAVWLSVWEHNPRAIAFYRKVGFADAGVTTFELGSETQRDLLMVRATIAVAADGAPNGPREAVDPSCTGEAPCRDANGETPSRDKSGRR